MYLTYNTVNSVYLYPARKNYEYISWLTETNQERRASDFPIEIGDDYEFILGNLKLFIRKNMLAGDAYYFGDIECWRSNGF